MQSNRLEAFIFRLGRDHVPPGVVEEHVKVVEAAHQPNQPIVYQGQTAALLGKWAHAITERLLGDMTAPPPELVTKLRAIIRMPYAGHPVPEVETRDAREATERLEMLEAKASRYDEIAAVVNGIRR